MDLGGRAARDNQLREGAVATSNIDPAQARARSEPIEEDIARGPAPRNSHHSLVGSPVVEADFPFGQAPAGNGLNRKMITSIANHLSIMSAPVVDYQAMTYIAFSSSRKQETRFTGLTRQAADRGSSRTRGRMRWTRQHRMRKGSQGGLLPVSDRPAREGTAVRREPRTTPPSPAPCCPTRRADPPAAGSQDWRPVTPPARVRSCDRRGTVLAVSTRWSAWIAISERMLRPSPAATAAWMPARLELV